MSRDRDGNGAGGGELRERLRRVMADVFEVAPSRIDESVDRESLEEWTSLAHLRLITELEAAFGIRVTMEEALGLDSFPALERILHERA